jgi:hypothetical protein
VAQVVATELVTIAAANDCWRLTTMDSQLT